jgi:hypothetical protein
MSRRTLAVLAGLCLLAYLPLFRQPLLEDDWPNIELARNWIGLLGHSVFRWRTVHWMLTNGIERAFGLWAPAYYAAAIAMHIAATWVVYAMGALPQIGWRVSAIAAAFFAVYEGHQEAVMWYSASAETLMFVFGAASVVLFTRRRTWPALALFVAALASKESAVIFAVLMLVTVYELRDPAGLRGALLRWLPFGGLAAAYAAWIAAARASSFRFRDGSFSLSAPFWITWPASCWRMLWIWGVAALIVLAWRRAWPRSARFGLLWMAVGLAPYVFLTYMTRVPSRHTYIASAGLALVVGAAVAKLGRRAATIAVLVFVLVNVGYLWTRKRAQFLERAAPTESVIAFARTTSAPVIYLRCFPGPPVTPESAVRLTTGKRVTWKPEPGAAEFCWSE